MAPPQRFSIWRAVCWLSCALQTVTALSDAPTPENFMRRGLARTIVLGNYLYIDGGEVSQLLDNGEFNGPRPSNMVNSTLSIDLTTSWSTSGVAIRSIPKPAPKTAYPAIFLDPASNAFYSWGGKFTYGNVTPAALWKFTADGSGGGSWAPDQPSNPSLLAQLHPSELGAHTTAASNGLGFLIGGIATRLTESGRSGSQAVPGTLTFDTKTKTFGNSSAFFSAISGAAAEFVPTFGPNGMVFVFGGHALDPAQEPRSGNFPGYDYRNLTFFDPETRQRYWQVATGDVPPSPRTMLCTAGMANAQGGYEVLVFGGENQRDKFKYQDAYVLSLPGFVWTKVGDAPGGPRFSQSCASVGGRQVVSVGGTNTGWEVKDPAPQGLLVFDMTALEWKAGYDAAVGEYVRAEGIEGWYASGAMENVTWSSDEVRALFATSGTAGPEVTPKPGGPGTRESSGGGVSAGVIAGGIVGALVGVAAIVAGVWFLLRRKGSKQDQAAGGENAPEVVVTEPKYYAYAVEADSESPYTEVSGEREAAELDPHHRMNPVELDAGYYQQRLSRTEN